MVVFGAVPIGSENRCAEFFKIGVGFFKIPNDVGKVNVKWLNLKRLFLTAQTIDKFDNFGVRFCERQNKSLHDI